MPETRSSEVVVEKQRALAVRPERSVRHGARRALLDAALALAAPPDAAGVARLLARITKLAALAVGGRDGRLVLAEDPAWGGLLPREGVWAGPITLDHAGRLFRRQLRPGGATHHAFTTGRDVVVRDTRRSRFGPYPQLAAPGVGSFAITPLRTSGRTLGVLGASFDEPGHPTADERATLTQFAAHAAAALERARLAHAAEQQRLRMERLAETLADVGGQTDLEGAIEALLRGAIGLLEGEDGVAQVFDAENGQHSLLLRMTHDGTVVARSRRSRPRPGSHAHALQAGGPSTLVRDFRDLDPREYPLYEQMVIRGLRTSVNVAIWAGGRPIGSLHVNHPEPGRYDERDLALAEMLANQGGAAIERARLEAARQRAERTLEQQALELGKREAEAAALRHVDDLKKEFFSTLSHELRTPLTVLMGYSHRLGERAGSLGEEDLRRMAGRMQRAAEQLRRLIEDMLDFARIERGQVAVTLAELDLAPLLRDVVAGFQDQPGGERLQLDAPGKVWARGDQVRVTQVASNLIANALKYAPQGPVQVRARADGPLVRVEVQDEGPGIPASEIDLVWEKFFRGVGVEGFSITAGTGLGLAVAKTLVQAQGGKVGVTSEPGHGATFWFELPAAAEEECAVGGA